MRGSSLFVRVTALQREAARFGRGSVVLMARAVVFRWNPVAFAWNAVVFRRDPVSFARNTVLFAWNPVVFWPKAVVFAWNAVVFAWNAVVLMVRAVVFRRKAVAPLEKSRSFACERLFPNNRRELFRKTRPSGLFPFEGEGTRTTALAPWPRGAPTLSRSSGARGLRKGEERAMKNNNRATRSNRFRLAIEGIRKHLSATPSMSVDGVSYALADVETILQGSIDAGDAATVAMAALHRAVDADKAARTKAVALYRGMRTLLIHQFRSQPDTLADFGILLPTRQVPDADTVANAVEKRKATRKARNTMGSRQKEKVKGTVVTTAPAPTPPAPVVAGPGSGTTAPHVA